MLISTVDRFHCLSSVLLIYRLFYTNSDDVNVSEPAADNYSQLQLTPTTDSQTYEQLSMYFTD